MIKTETLSLYLYHVTRCCVDCTMCSLVALVTCSSYDVFDMYQTVVSRDCFYVLCHEMIYYIILDYNDFFLQFFT